MSARVASLGWRLALVLVGVWLVTQVSSARAAYTLYAANNSAGDNVSAFSVGKGGALTPLAGSPFSAGAFTPSRFLFAAAVTPDGRHLYTADGGGPFGYSDVSAFSIGRDGALSLLPGSPFTAGTGPVSVAVSPNGDDLYVTNNFSNDVSAFSIGSDGALTPVPGSPFPAGNGANGLAVTPDGHHLYVIDVGTGSEYVTAFSIGSDGALTPVPGSPFPIGSDGCGVAVTPDGDHLYVANMGSDSNDVSAFAIGSDGALTPVPGSPFPAGKGPCGLAVTPDGGHLYVANDLAGDVSAFAIGSDGALSAVSGSPFPAGSGPIGIAVTPDGDHLYVTSDSNELSAFTIGSDGALSPVSGSPFASDSGPDALVVPPDQGPVAAFSATAATAGSPSAFDGSASHDPDGTVARYDWSFGDGTSDLDAGPKPMHVYAKPGDYAVTLTVADAAGCSTSQTFTGQTVSCNGSPAARVSHQLAVSSAPPPTTTTSPTSPSPSPSPLPGPSPAPPLAPPLLLPPPLPPPPPPPPMTRALTSAAPVLRGLKVSPKRFSLAGRRSRRRCSKPTRHNKHRPPCTRKAKLTVHYSLSRAVKVKFKITGRLRGQLARRGRAGRDHFALTRRLAAGRYKLTATPAGGGARHVMFRILR